MLCKRPTQPTITHSVPFALSSSKRSHFSEKNFLSVLLLFCLPDKLKGWRDKNKGRFSFEIARGRKAKISFCKFIIPFSPFQFYGFLFVNKVSRTGELIILVWFPFGIFLKWQKEISIAIFSSWFNFSCSQLGPKRAAFHWHSFLFFSTEICEGPRKDFVLIYKPCLWWKLYIFNND